MGLENSGFDFGIDVDSDIKEPKHKSELDFSAKPKGEAGITADFGPDAEQGGRKGLKKSKSHLGFGAEVNPDPKAGDIETKQNKTPYFSLAGLNLKKPKAIRK